MRNKPHKPHIGYKKLANDLIAVLEILGINNESRDGIHDINCAKHRCSKAQVLDIYHMNDKNKKEPFGFNKMDGSMRYNVGEIVKVKDYDKGLHNVCSTGIHYFLSEECAYRWCHPLMSESNLKEWHDNGQLKSETIYDPVEKLYLTKQWSTDGVLVRDTKRKRVTGEYVGLYINGYTFRTTVNGVFHHNDERGYFNNNSNKDGLWIKSINGKKTEAIWYNDGKLVKKYEYWPKSGKLRSESYYYGGFLNGTCKTWYKNGNLKKQVNYEYGVANGLYTLYYSNGQVCIVGQNKDGLMERLWIYYYKNGQVKMKCEYSNDQRNGQAITYYKNGQVKMKCESSNDQRNGQAITFYKNGQVKSKRGYSNGQKDGEAINYNKNGDLKLKCEYSNGQKDGKMIRYYKTGELMNIKTYEHNVLNGSYSKYHKNGGLSIVGNIRCDKKYGPWQYFDDNGKCQRIKLFR